MNSAMESGEPLDAELADAVYLNDFAEAAKGLAALHGIAWRALESELGAEVALELAVDLLPPLVQSAQREAMTRALERQQAREQLALAQLAQQRLSRPQLPENPW